MKYSVRAILRCDSSEWRASASGFSIARLSRRDWCALPVSICSSLSFSSCGGLLFSFCTSRGPFSSPAACTVSLRYDWYAWTVGFRNFLPDRPSKYRQTDPRTWRIESLRKNCPIFGKAYMFKVDRVLVKCDFWEAGFGFLCGAAWFRLSRNRRFDQRRTITYFGDPSGEHTVKHYCFIDIDLFFPTPFSPHSHCLPVHKWHFFFLLAHSFWHSLTMRESLETSDLKTEHWPPFLSYH